MNSSPSATWQALLSELFPNGHDVICSDCFLHGTGQSAGETVAVLGTTEHAPIGVEMALASARFVLDVVRDHPRRPIVMLVDTEGQRLRHRDELLGINAYMAHLGQCVELARMRGHRTLALIYDQALSGGFIATGMMADACYALRHAEIRVMNLPAMARVTKQPVEKLEALSLSSPVFAPGVENYVQMGAVQSIWSADLAAALTAALQEPHSSAADLRAAAGKERGGRALAADVASRVKAGET